MGVEVDADKSETKLIWNVAEAGMCMPASKACVRDVYIYIYIYFIYLYIHIYIYETSFLSS